MFHYNMFHFFYNGVLYDASRPLMFDIECGPYEFFLIYMILPVIIMSPKLRQWCIKFMIYEIISYLFMKMCHLELLLH